MAQTTQPFFMVCMAKADACYLRANLGWVQWKSGVNGEWQNLFEIAEIAPLAIDAEAATLAQAICALNARISALEEKLRGNLGDVMVNKIVINKGIDQYGSEGNTVLKGEGAPSVIPQYSGQEYIDTIEEDHYKSKGNTAVSDWQKINN